ncbi:MAG: UDP-N-acetylmuramoyl-tripeptide--D-alanyl-D-alanine ligase [Propionibacteriaceae bacterium]|nr:UDP-N-acetylmuramoyl-tripeptide--D-alanyl-D-alanine ligase [Propionibacteriaceae bacterium]
MDILSAGEVASACQGKLIGDPETLVGSAVEIDSRLVTPGAIFVALGGEKTDGHNFITDAIARGAAAVLVKQELELPIPVIVVADPLVGLTNLASYLVEAARARQTWSLAVTGSSGKTSTKDLLSQILETDGETVAPVGSFNNEIGVPLTATRITSKTRFLVSEFGSRGIGHIAALAQIVPVDTAVVLNVGQVHLSEFGTIEDVARGKGELVQAAQNWAVLNADDHRVLAMQELTAAKLATFSAHAEPTVGTLRLYATDCTADEQQRFSFNVQISGMVEAKAHVKLQVVGRHQISNALAAVGAALTAGLEFETAIAALNKAVVRSKWRMEMSSNPNGLTIINDAYNANPDSMRAGLRTLAGLRPDGGKLIAVLGDMLELGEITPAAHYAVGEFAAQLGIDLLVALGDQRDQLVAGAMSAGARAVAAANTEEAVALVDSFASQNDVVLVKASRAIALENVVKRLGALQA